MRKYINTGLFVNIQFFKRFGVYLVFKPMKNGNTIVNKTQLHIPQNRIKRTFLSNMKRY